MKKTKIEGQDELINDLTKVFKIFKNSNHEIRPHFILTGESGSGKSITIKTLSESFDVNYLEINAASLTKEGTSGNSLTKALSPLLNIGNKSTIIFVDEFDKLFISGNSNTEIAHESTNGVQNEFLKILESDTASVFGDYGKYLNVSVNHVLFVFAGSFNGEEEIDIDKLRSFGLKTEFLGRVGLVFNTKKLNLDTLFTILENSPLLETYLELFKKVDREKAILTIKAALKDSYENNTLGARAINTLIHQYFIKGKSFNKKDAKKITFQKSMEL